MRFSGLSLETFDLIHENLRLIYEGLHLSLEGGDGFRGFLVHGMEWVDWGEEEKSSENSPTERFLETQYHQK